MARDPLFAQLEQGEQHILPIIGAHPIDLLAARKICVTQAEVNQIQPRTERRADLHVFDFPADVAPPAPPPQEGHPAQRPPPVRVRHAVM